MKKVMFALCFMFGGIVTVVAQDQQDTTSNQYRTETQSQYPQDALGQDQDRERIQSTELPDEVKRSLEGEEYRGWLVSGAFKAKASAGQSMESDTTSVDPNQQADPSNNAAGMEEEEVYIVELKNGAETKTIRFDANGQKIEGMEGQDEMDQNNQFNQNEQMNQNELPAPADQTTPAPADQTTPAPEDQTVPTPDDQVTPAPEGQTESNQYNETEADPASETETDPASETETESTETESDQSIDESSPETEETSTETETESTTDRP